MNHVAVFYSSPECVLITQMIVPQSFSASNNSTPWTYRHLYHSNSMTTYVARRFCIVYTATKHLFYQIRSCCYSRWQTIRVVSASRGNSPFQTMKFLILLLVITKNSKSCLSFFRGVFFVRFFVLYKTEIFVPSNKVLWWKKSVVWPQVSPSSPPPLGVAYPPASSVGTAHYRTNYTHTGTTRERRQPVSEAAEIV